VIIFVILHAGCTPECDNTLNTTLYPLASAFCPLASAFCPLASAFCLLPSKH